MEQEAAGDFRDCGDRVMEDGPAVQRSLALDPANKANVIALGFVTSAAGCANATSLEMPRA